VYRLGSLICSASFAEPAFHVSRQSFGLQTALFRSLRPFGPKINDLTENVSTQGAARWSLTLAIPAVSGVRPGLNFSADASGFTTTFLAPGRAVSGAMAVLESLEAAVREALPDTQIGLREFTFGAHLDLPPSAYQTLTEPFLKPPPQGLGAPSAHGVSFYFGETSALVLDRSVIIPGGLFFQVRSRVDSGDLDSGFADFLSLLERGIEATKIGGAF
jgi:hypothetical protein